MKKTIFQGAGVAIVTPMNEDFSIHYRLFGALIDDQIERGSDAIVVAGTTGEASTLSDAEHLELIEYAVKRAAGRVPVIAGAGGNNTAHAVWFSKECERVGADALLHVTPYYNKASQQGLYEHFRACASATGLPVILYNVPSRTGVNILPETFCRLSEIDSIVAAKEASGNIAQFAKTASLCGDRLDLYTGNDDQIVPALSLGAKGVISVLSNILPERTHEICASWFAGDTAQSARLQLEYLDLIEALFSDVSPIPVKQALNFMGWNVGSCRLPLCGMDGAAAGRLLATLKRHHLIQYGEVGSTLLTRSFQRRYKRLKTS